MAVSAIQHLDVSVNSKKFARLALSGIAEILAKKGRPEGRPDSQLWLYLIFPAHLWEEDHVADAWAVGQ